MCIHAAFIAAWRRPFRGIVSMHKQVGQLRVLQELYILITK